MSKKVRLWWLIVVIDLAIGKQGGNDPILNEWFEQLKDW